VILGWEGSNSHFANSEFTIFSHHPLASLYSSGLHENLAEIGSFYGSIFVCVKQHKNLLRAIRKMEPAWEKVNGCKFALVEYRDKKGEFRPCYSLTKTECLYIATKFNDEARAIVAVCLDISYWKINLKALDKAYSIAFPHSTPINVNKKVKVTG
jgi:hypothetical protein